MNMCMTSEPPDNSKKGLTSRIEAFIKPTGGSPEKASKKHLPVTTKHGTGPPYWYPTAATVCRRTSVGTLRNVRLIAQETLMSIVLITANPT